jgi:hypothetical protein
MTSEELNVYREHMHAETGLWMYVPRRFTAATIEGGTDPDLGFQWRGVLREGEPKLEEILKHPRLVILGEPGAGKSLVARAAAQEFVRNDERVPVLSELKHYRGDLQGLLEVGAPRSILEPNASVDGKLLKRTYILDGLDEIPLELLAFFGKELEALLRADSTANVLLTARQAFYVTERALLPQFPAVFHILDFSDDDIRVYLDNRHVDTEAFLRAVRLAEADEEIRNPFVLSVIVDRFVETGALGKLRSDNLRYIIDRLIQSRPLVNHHRQRRALSMLAIASETYCRNELAGDEALRVIKEAMRITDEGARQMLDELHASILRRTVNGFAFQMRSYGEYLAAEVLEDEPVHRLRELAFVDRDTPNESWSNTVGYLAEINSRVRTLFVEKYPFWMINSSPAAFSDAEKGRLVRAIFKTLADEDHYIYRHPRINLLRLGRFLTPDVEPGLLAELASPRQLVRGNALVLLSLRPHPDVVPIALVILRDRTLDLNFRQCAVLAIRKAGNPTLVPELVAFLDQSDPLHDEILDSIGALGDESQIPLVLPLLLAAGNILSASFYHFREFRSRQAVLEMLGYFAAHPHDLNVIRAEGYLEPVLNLLPKYWDEMVVERCVRIIEAIDEQKIYPDRSGIAYKLFHAIKVADSRGAVAKRFLENLLKKGQADRQRWFYVDELIADLMTPETAQWLIDNRATASIQQFAGYLRGPVRDLLRPYSNGLIDAQEENARAYAAERTEKESARKQELALLQERISTGKDFHQTLNDFYGLSESHWPELTADHKAWLAAEVSRFLVALDLEHSVVWKDDTLTIPAALPVVLKLAHRYELTIDPDTPLIFATASWDEQLVAGYYRRRGLSPLAYQLLETLLLHPQSPRALAGIVGFVRDSGLWSANVETGLIQVTRDPVSMYCQIDALHLLAQHGVETELLEEIATRGSSENLRQLAFRFLVGQQHRPTIERALHALLTDDQALRNGETDHPFETSLGWIAKIQSEFAIPKLIDLRGKALDLELPKVASLLTETLVKIDRPRAAQVIRRQIPRAPLGWRQAQQSIAVEQERAAKIERTQNSPFEVILAKLKGSTSIRRLKLWCEGPTDIPVFKALLAQVPYTPEILLDFVGGWPMLQAKDPQTFQHGCYEAVVVMDGDKGRRLDKPRKPLTRLAKEQRGRFTSLPVELHVLERYGIENYFPQSSLETVVGQDLTPFFPIPDHVSVCEYLRGPKLGWWERAKRFLVSRCHLKLELGGSSLYAKRSNEQVAQLLVLDRDLPGTDLSAIIHRVAEQAKALADS